MKIKIHGKELDVDESKLSPEALSKAKMMADGGQAGPLPAPVLDYASMRGSSDDSKLDQVRTNTKDAYDKQQRQIDSYAKGGNVNPKLAQVPEKDRFQNNLKRVQRYAGDSSDPSASVVQPDSSSSEQSPDAELIQQAGGTPAPIPQPAPSQAPIINNHYYMAPSPTPAPAPSPVVPADNSQPSDTNAQLANSGINPSAPDAAQQAQNQGSPIVPAASSEGTYQPASPAPSAPAPPAPVVAPAANASAPAPSNPPVSAAPTALDTSMDKANQDYQALVRQQQEGDRKFEAALATKQVDPNRYLNNAGLGTKILHGLGMVLSIAAPNIGKTILANINGDINRDIDAQKNDQSNTTNLWKMHHEALGSDMAATLQTRNNMLEMTKVKTDEMMGNIGNNPLAQQKAVALKGSLDAEIAQNNSIIAQQKMKQKILNGQSMGTGNAQLSNQDPASLVPFVVPEANQPKVFDEIKGAQNVTQNGPKILAAFDEAAKEQRVMSGGSVKNLIPGVNSQSVGSLHQLLLPNFKSIDGTVRQAAMDETFHNVTPQAFDNDAKVAGRRQALVDWLHSEASAPTAKGYGIDLNKYQSTAEKTTSSKSGTVAVQAPNGQIKLVPSNQLSAALAAGGKQVNQ